MLTQTCDFEGEIPSSSLRGGKWFGWPIHDDLRFTIFKIMIFYGKLLNYQRDPGGMFLPIKDLPEIWLGYQNMAKDEKSKYPMKVE